MVNVMLHEKRFLATLIDAGIGIVLSFLFSILLNIFLVSIKINFKLLSIVYVASCSVIKIIEPTCKLEFCRDNSLYTSNNVLNTFND